MKQESLPHPKYLVGIDLGTTNCTMAYSRLSDADTADTFGIEQFGVPQITAPETEGESAVLPSFLYFPLPEEKEAKLAGISWDPTRAFCVGAFAQKRGIEMPTRLISSAKSWLCHSEIDRRRPFLPFPSEEELKGERFSPLQVSAELLRHLREAWDLKMDEPLIKQSVLITVPASFDPSARELVLEAAKMSGFPEVVLLEEPQAAFYAWMQANDQEWRKILKVGDCILVVDIGGGTTDFSLIGVKDEGGNLSLERQAVGSHLLLGGDNIDLSLSYLAKQKLEEQGAEIDEWQMQSLLHSCRHAKEVLMGDTPPEHVDISVMGRGSRLIGGSLKTKITLVEAEQVILEGFAPLVLPTERSKVERHAGLKQIGLPFAKDPRFTAQLAKFLSMTAESDSESMDQFVIPTAVLFNGGTTKASALRTRLIAQLNAWAKQLGKSEVCILPGVDYDFAVSRGAVSYGKARRGEAIRIRSGTNRSFFIGVEEALPAVPGVPAPLRAVCIAPFGMEEGSELQLNEEEFTLVIGEPVLFRFFSHASSKLSDGRQAALGTVVRRWKQELTELHPIETHLDSVEGDGKVIRVHIHSRVTELGVLEIWCVAGDGRKWKLEFDARNPVMVT